MVKTPLQGAQAGTLIGELRSHKPTSVAKQKKGFFPSSLGFLVYFLHILLQFVLVMRLCI